MRTRRPGLILTLLVGLIGCSASNQPIEPLAKDIGDPPDPAVQHANATGDPANPYSEGYLGSGDERIHFVEAGSGSTVLFVHGFPSFWYSWFDQMEAFKACRRVIAIDALGAGRSAKPSDIDHYRVQNLAEGLDAVISQLAPDEKIVLVGHDWGGALAWSYAENDSSRLDRLAIFSAPPQALLLDMLVNDPEQRARSSYMPRLAQMDAATASSPVTIEMIYQLGYARMVKSGVLSEAEGKLFRDALALPGALAGGAAWYRANVPAFDRIDLDRDPWPARNAKTDIPTLLVRGELDRTFVKAMEERAKDHASDLTVVTIDGVGHSTPYEDPQTANAHLGTFLGLPDGKCPR